MSENEVKRLIEAQSMPEISATQLLIIADLGVFADELETALLAEYAARMHVGSAEAYAKKVEANVLEKAKANGLIDGKAAGDRKQQREEELAKSEEYCKALETLANRQETAKKMEFARRRIEERNSLVKAWLYSQGGRL